MTPAERAISLLQQAISVLSGQVNAPATQAGVDDAASRYLADNPDVAKHIYFSRHPLEHWQVHGQKEGRQWPAVPSAWSPEPIVEPHADEEAPQPTIKDDSPALRNFKHLKETLGDDAAYDYLIKHVPGGAELVRGMFTDRTESARIVNRYAVGSQKGFVDDKTGEYVLGGNPFTREGGTRTKLPG